MTKILAIIPARGGSKSIPGKNLVDVGGKPLIDWSIQTGLELLQLGSVHRLIVSTDDERIASRALELGVEVPFLRPSELASDTSRSIDFVIHALDHYQERNVDFEAVLILQPTSPRRSTEAISRAVTQFNEMKMDSMISCYLDQYLSPNVLYEWDNDSSFIRPVSEEHSAGIRRQDERSVLVRAGVLYLARTEFIRQELRLISDRPGLYLIPKTESINLDTKEDLDLLRATF